MFERRGVGVEADEHHPAPLGQLHRLQRVVGDIEPLRFTDAGGTCQRSVQLVQPRVVWAADQRARVRLAVLAQRRRTMTAHVEERPQFAGLVANEQHRQTANHRAP